MTGLAAASAATTDHQIRESNLVRARQDTKATYTFLADGIQVKVNDSAQFVRGLFATNVNLADVHNVTFDWTGTGYGSQGDNASGQSVGNTAPIALRYNVDIDGDGSWDCQLVGETIYGGQDVWLNRDVEDSPTPTLPAGTCATKAPSHTTGFGSLDHGTLDQWADSLRTARDKEPKVVQSGFVGSDFIINGLLRSISLGTDRYAFTSTAAAPAAQDVTGSATHTTSGPRATVTLTSDALPAGTPEGDKIAWTIKAGTQGKTTYTKLTDSQGAGEKLFWQYTFPTNYPTQVVEVYKNGVKVQAFLVRPGS